MDCGILGQDFVGTPWIGQAGESDIPVEGGAAGGGAPVEIAATEVVIGYDQAFGTKKVLAIFGGEFGTGPTDSADERRQGAKELGPAHPDSESSALFGENIRKRTQGRLKQDSVADKSGSEDCGVAGRVGYGVSKDAAEVSSEPQGAADDALAQSVEDRVRKLEKRFVGLGTVGGTDFSGSLNDSPLSSEPYPAGAV
jgi:hypothetical protein